MCFDITPKKSPIGQGHPSFAKLMGLGQRGSWHSVPLKAYILHLLPETAAFLIFQVPKSLESLAAFFFSHNSALSASLPTRTVPQPPNPLAELVLVGCQLGTLQ